MLTPDVLNVKLGTAHEIGVQLDNQLEAAERDVFALGGAVEGLANASKQIEQLQTLVMAEADAGRLSDLNPLQVAAKIKEYVLKSQMICQQLGTNMGVQRFVAQGRIQGLKGAVDSVKKFHGSTENQLKASVTAAQEAEKSPVRTPGRPAPTLRSQRTNDTSDVPTQPPINAETPAEVKPLDAPDA